MAREEQLKETFVNDGNKLFTSKITGNRTLLNNKKLRVGCRLPAME